MVLGSPVKERLETIFKEIAEKKGLTIRAMEIMPDHIHMFVSAPPQHSPSKLINWFKGIGSHLYNHRFGSEGRIRWTSAYYVGTAGTVSKDIIERYINEQTKCRDTSVESQE